MKAVVLYEYGDVNQLQFRTDWREPAYAPNEVRVRVRATSINPIDWKLRSGAAQKRMPLNLPAILGRGRPLRLRAWEFGAPLDRGQWGIREPKPEAAEVEPDILLVPLLAFDRSGHRVGYGAGYYDLTITQLRARKTVVAVGLAFALQEVAAVPATPRDARLDLVLTEREVIDLRGQ